MKIKYLFFLLLLPCCYKSRAQSKHTIFLNSGYTFNEDIQLNEDIIKKSRGYSLDVGFTYRFFTSQCITAQIGFSGKTIFAAGQLPTHTFQATTFRLTAPLKWSYHFPKTPFALTGGFVFQNNVDFTEFDFRLRDKYAWRVNYLLEVRYTLNPQTNLLLGWQNNLRNIPDLYFISDPKRTIVIGLTKTIYWKKNKKP